MIESVKIVGLPTYRNKEHVFGPLGTFNFVFGCNGSGKTTLARIIAAPTQHPTCKVEWRAVPLATYVYDHNFVAANFRQELKGVFTLGAKDIELKQRIEAAKNLCDETEGKIRKWKEQIDGNSVDHGEKKHLKSLEEVFNGKCFKVKQDHYKKLDKAMAGFVGSQAKFAAKVLAEHNSNKATLHSLEELISKHDKLHGTDLVALSDVEVINIDDIKAIESNPLLQKVVIGKSDVAIAALISALGNSDWVDQGQEFLAKSDGVCPFCQRPAPADLQKHLEEYFDKTFIEDSSCISELESAYRRHALKLQQNVDRVMDAASEYLSKDAVAKEKQLIVAVITANINAMEGKRREPSHVVTLQSIEEVCKPLFSIIAAANKAIKDHNAIVANLSKERSKLVDEVWRFVVEQVRDEVPKYLKGKLQSERKIAEISTKVSEAEAMLNLQRNNLHQLEKSSTSVKPSIKNINDILSSFGFQGFKLAEGEGSDTYKIVRPDGQAASETLSEGEKTFITFLYFYHLARGSNAESGTLEDRVVVFDDPVSSLDSNVLFIISSLIRRLLRAVHDKCEIKQVIVLTHNVFFHKEVTLPRAKESFGNRKYWVVRKTGSDSSIVGYDNKNPIKSSYERLWDSLRHCDGTPESLHALQNTMRRILENYFTILGGVDLSDLEEKFDGNDKLICRSLVAWVHDGSHAIYDDLFMSETEATADMFLGIFKKIFEKLQHPSHYEMMMENKLEVAIPPE